MITTPQIVESIIKKSPFLEEALLKNLINISSLARQIQPQVQLHLEQKTLRESPIKLGAIIMALKRLKANLNLTDSSVEKVLKKITDITVRSNITEYTYKNSPNLAKKQSQLLDLLTSQTNGFVTFTHGVFETTLFASNHLEQVVQKLFVSEQLVRKMAGLSSITLILPFEATEVPGVYYAILKQLAWEGISFEEIASSFSEVTIFLHQEKVDQAFSALKSLSDMNYLLN